jgi:hypothetical protein
MLIPRVGFEIAIPVFEPSMAARALDSVPNTIDLIS